MAVACTFVPTTAGLSYARSSVATGELVAAGDAAARPTDDREHEADAAPTISASHTTKRGAAHVSDRTAGSLWNDRDLRGLYFEGLELAGAPLRILRGHRVPHEIGR